MTGAALRVVVGAALATIGLVFVYAFWSRAYLDAATTQRRTRVQAMVAVARNAIEPVLGQVRSGQISKQQGLRQVRESLRRMAFTDENGANYYFLVGYDGVLILQPFEPQNEGKIQIDRVDSMGYPLIRELIRAARSPSGSGFVEYRWPHPPSMVEETKLSYAVGLPELGCLLGTGTYVGAEATHQVRLLREALAMTACLGLLVLLPALLAIRDFGKRNETLREEVARRKAVQRELAASESRKSLAISSVRDGLWDWNVASGEVFFDDSYYAMLGYKPGAFPMTYDNWRDRLHPEDGERADAALRDVFRGNAEGFELEFRMLDGEGNWRWVLSRGRVVERDEAGLVARLIGMHTDVTERRSAEEMLRASERRFRELAALLPLVVFECDTKGKLTYANDRAYEEYGFSRDALDNGLNVFDLVSPDDALYAKERFAKAISGIGLGGGDYTALRSDGSSFPVTVYTSCIVEGGEVKGLRGVTIDMTDVKATEKALRASEEKFRRVFESLQDGYFLVSLDGIIQDANPAAASMLGWDEPRYLVGRNINEDVYAHPQDREGLLADLRASDGPVFGFETRFKRRDGTELFVDLCVHFVRDFNGQPIMVEGSVRDVSARKAAEMALRDQADRLTLLNQLDRSILNSESARTIAASALVQMRRLIPCAMASVVSVDGAAMEARVLHAESDPDLVAGAWTPLPTCEYHVGRLRLGEIIDDPDMASPNHDCAVQTILRGWGLQSRLAVPMLVNGELKGCLIVAAKEVRAFGSKEMSIAREIANQLAIGINLSELNERAVRQAAEMERSVEERTAQLKRANEDLEAFSFSVSHDLQAPLRHIIAFTEMALHNAEGKLEPKKIAHLMEVINSANRMQRLIEDLLKLSRVARAELAIRPVDLSEVARNVIEELRRYGEVHEVVVTIEDGLVVDCDKALAYIALTNLLGNAWKFTSTTSKATIEFGRDRDRADAPLFVRDDGVGFDMAYAGRLFGAFQRLHSEKEFAGTGIGLATVQRVVSRHGGRIWAEAAEGQGATFYFTLGPVLGQPRPARAVVGEIRQPTEIVD